MFSIKIIVLTLWCFVYAYSTSTSKTINLDLETSFLHTDQLNTGDKELNLTICYIETNPVSNIVVQIELITTQTEEGDKTQYFLNVSDSNIFKKRYTVTSDAIDKLKEANKKHWMVSAENIVKEWIKLSKSDHPIEPIKFNDKIEGFISTDSSITFEIDNFCVPKGDKSKHTLIIQVDQNVVNNGNLLKVTLYEIDIADGSRSVVNSYPEDFSFKTAIDFTNELHYNLMLKPKDKSEKKVLIVFVTKTIVLLLLILVTLGVFYYYQRKKFKRKQRVTIYKGKPDAQDI